MKMTLIVTGVLRSGLGLHEEVFARRRQPVRARGGLANEIRQNGVKLSVQHNGFALEQRQSLHNRVSLEEGHGWPV